MGCFTFQWERFSREMSTNPKWLFTEEDLDGLVLVAVDLQANLERMLSIKEDHILGKVEAP